MKSIFIFILSFTSFHFCLALDQAVFEKDLPIDRNIEIEILGFNESQKMIKIQSTKFPGEGFSWVNSQTLSESVVLEPDRENIQKMLIKTISRKIMGKKFVLSKKIPTFVIKDDSE